MLEDIFLWCPIVKNSHYGCFDRLGAQGFAIAVFNPMTAQRCVLCRQRFSSLVCQALAGVMSIYYKNLPAVLETMGWCAQEGVPNNVISAPKLSDFLFCLFKVGLAWHTIGIYHSAISAIL